MLLFRTHSSNVESGWCSNIVVGVDAVSILPASPVGGIILAAGSSAWRDGLSGEEMIDDRVGCWDGADELGERKERRDTASGRRI